jgi:hypothetical protein
MGDVWMVQEDLVDAKPDTSRSGGCDVTSAAESAASDAAASWDWASHSRARLLAARRREFSSFWEASCHLLDWDVSW